MFIDNVALKNQRGAKCLHFAPRKNGIGMQSINASRAYGARSHDLVSRRDQPRLGCFRIVRRCQELPGDR
jgi:hypothetical protein